MGEVYNVKFLSPSVKGELPIAKVRFLRRDAAENLMKYSPINCNRGLILTARRPLHIEPIPGGVMSTHWRRYCFSFPLFLEEDDDTIVGDIR